MKHIRQFVGLCLIMIGGVAAAIQLALAVSPDLFNWRVIGVYITLAIIAFGILMVVERIE